MAQATFAMAGLSVVHEGEPDKPNEDAFCIHPDRGLAIVADGVSRSRRPDGTYPAELATRAPELLLRIVSEQLADFPRFWEPGTVREAVTAANAAIRKENEDRGITQVVNYDTVDYLGTTACILSLAARADHAFGTFGFIGDPVAFLVRNSGTATLLTRDQLDGCHRFGRPYFKALAAREGLSDEEALRQRRIWNRSYARNRREATDPDGHSVGYGVLTGEPGAMHFFEAQLVLARPGDRFILASDALRACAEFGILETESAASYQSMVPLIRMSNLGAVPEILVREIRTRERMRKSRSDDATVVVVEVQ